MHNHPPLVITRTITVKGVLSIYEAEPMKLFYFLIIFLLAPCTSFAAGVIGQDGVITIPTLTIITGQGEYGDVFNFFFTLMFLSGLISVFFKNVIRLFRQRYG